MSDDDFNANAAVWKVNSYSVMGICLPLDPPENVKESIEALKKMVLDSAAGAYIEDM
jgi:hypothetical protein